MDDFDKLKHIRSTGSTLYVVVSSLHIFEASHKHPTTSLLFGASLLMAIFASSSKMFEISTCSVVTTLIFPSTKSILFLYRRSQGGSTWSKWTITNFSLPPIEIVTQGLMAFPMIAWNSVWVGTCVAFRDVTLARSIRVFSESYGMQMSNES